MLNEPLLAFLKAILVLVYSVSQLSTDNTLHWSGPGRSRQRKDDMRKDAKRGKIMRKEKKDGNEREKRYIQDIQTKKIWNIKIRKKILY